MNPCWMSASGVWRAKDMADSRIQAGDRTSGR
jgi:hypothetical protein